MMVAAMRCFAISTGGCRARIACATVIERARSPEAKISSAARVSTPALSGCSGKVCANFTPASVARPCQASFSAPCRPSSPFWKETSPA
jgi:hypothetical protein